MKPSPLTLIGGCLIVLSGQKMPPLNYPPAPKSSQADVYHGVQIADPYRGLENADAPETRKWVEDENGLTQSWVGKQPGRDTIRQPLNRCATALCGGDEMNDPRQERIGAHAVRAHHEGPLPVQCRADHPIVGVLLDGNRLARHHRLIDGARAL